MTVVCLTYFDIRYVHKNALYVIYSSFNATIVHTSSRHKHVSLSGKELQSTTDVHTKLYS